MKASRADLRGRGRYLLAYLVAQNGGADVAARIGATRLSVWNWSRGRFKPSRVYQKKMSRILGIPVAAWTEAEE